MRENRGNTGRGRLLKKKFILYMTIAALCGVGIGILIGMLLARHEDRVIKTAVQEEVQETTAQSIPEETEKPAVTEEPSEPEASSGAKESDKTEDTAEAAVKEEQISQKLLGLDGYEAFLQEAAIKKNVSTGNVDLLVVSNDMYSRLFDPSYPMHPYNTEAFVWGEDGRMTYAENKSYRVRHGIDVSEFNENIDWEAVKEDGIEFVIIRMGFRGYGEGDIYEDGYFAANLAGAQAAGLDVGIYFFAQAVSEEEAEEEAKYVIDRLGGTELQMPIFYDVEPIRTDDARTDDVTGEQITKNTAAFCKVIQDSGYEAGYYGNLKWEMFMLDMRKLTDYTMWFAGYADRPQTAYNFSIWQYTDQGAVEGVPTNVDMDIQLIPVTPEEAAAIEAAEKKAAEEKAAAEKKAAEEQAAAEKKAAEEKAAAETEKTEENQAETEPSDSDA